VSERVAVVTGAASGMGLAIARELAAGGDAVALLDLNGDRLREAATDLTQRGLRAAPFEVDVAERSAVERVFAAVRDELGPVTILVTSAGIEAFDPCLLYTSRCV